MSRRTGSLPGGWTRTVLAINPSHATAIESAFWRDVASACTKRGWRLVQIAARKIPSIPDADTFTFPARLADFHRWAVGVDREVSWLDDDTRALHVAWEHRRWDPALHEPTVWDAVESLAAVIEAAIITLRPAAVLTTNKIDHPCALGRAAAHHHGVPIVGLIERSPFESIWFERDGLFAESAIWRSDSRWREVTDGAQAGRNVVERLRRNPAGFRSNEAATSSGADLDGLRSPVVFLPLDNILWTGWLPDGHPQGATDYPILGSPAAALETIGHWVERLGGTLLVKPHPSCIEAAKLCLPTAARLVDGPLGDIFSAADVTVAFNTKVAFASLAAGVRTATLADNPVAAGGDTAHWSDFATPTDTLTAALDGPPVTADRVMEFFGRLERGHFYGARDDEPSAAASDLMADIVRWTADESLVAPDADSCGRCFPQLDCIVRPSPSIHIGREPRRVVLAADRLVDPYNQVSGIARYGWELVAGLDDDATRELHVLLREPSVGWHRGAEPLFDRLRRRLGRRLVTVATSQRQEAALAHLGRLGPADVVHSIHLPLPSPEVTGDAARVLTVHDVLHLARPDLRAGSGPPTIERIVASIDTRRDFLICDSGHTRRDLMSLGPFDGDRIETVPLGAAPPCPCDGGDAARPVPAGWDGYIVTMLQSEPRKNGPAMLAAIRDVLGSSSFRGVGAVVVGPVSAIRLHRDDIDAIDRTRVVTSADLTDHDLEHLFRGARAFLYASLYEGFGLPPLEAMAAGCPVVVAANSSLVEVVGDAGLYAHSGSADDIAAALRLVLASASLRDELARRGRQRAAGLTWANTVRATLALYEKFTRSVRAAA